jgi:hypothetical protein
MEVREVEQSNLMMRLGCRGCPGKSKPVLKYSCLGGDGKLLKPMRDHAKKGSACGGGGAVTSIRTFRAAIPSSTPSWMPWNLDKTKNPSLPRLEFQSRPRVSKLGI